jgi:hypothetical protein
MATTRSRNYPLCNIVYRDNDSILLKSYSTRGKSASRIREIIAAENEAFPKIRYDKTWRDSFSPKLNVALIPSSEVFFRILSLPTTDVSEIPDMIELQLERISPLPVNQIFWTYELLPGLNSGSTATTNTLVCIVEQKAVYNLASDLESRHFYPDRIAPDNLIHFTGPPRRRELLRIITSNVTSRFECLIQWWVEGELHNISQIQEESMEKMIAQVEQEIRQTYWAGQMEGWVDELPPLQIECPTEQHAHWNALKEALDVSSMSLQETDSTEELDSRLAGLYARGDVRCDFQPGDLKKAYQSRQFDSQWMSALGALAVLYLIGLAGYFLLLNRAQAEFRGVRSNISAISGVYTNALKLDEQIRITQNQLDLRYAALDSWKAVVEVLPEELNFRQFKFSKGESLLISGQGPYGKNSLVNTYVDALGKLRDGDDTPLFTDVQAKPIQNARGAMNWSIEAMLPE